VGREPWCTHPAQDDQRNDQAAGKGKTVSKEFLPGVGHFLENVSGPDLPSRAVAPQEPSFRRTIWRFQGGTRATPAGFQGNRREMRDEAFERKAYCHPGNGWIRAERASGA